MAKVKLLASFIFDKQGFTFATLFSKLHTHVLYQNAMCSFSLGP